MEASEQAVDAWIVCALPEEAKAFLEAVKPFCKGKIDKGISTTYGCSFQQMCIINKDTTGESF